MVHYQKFHKKGKMLFFTVYSRYGSLRTKCQAQNLLSRYLPYEMCQTIT